LNHEHVLAIVGWGETSDGTPYWILRNSWGIYWGDLGYAKLLRGSNNMGIETACSMGIPKDTWTEAEAAKKNASLP